MPAHCSSIRRGLGCRGLRGAPPPRDTTATPSAPEVGGRLRDKSRGRRYQLGSKLPVGAHAPATVGKTPESARAREGCLRGRGAQPKGRCLPALGPPERDPWGLHTQGQAREGPGSAHKTRGGAEDHLTARFVPGLGAPRSSCPCPSSGWAESPASSSRRPARGGDSDTGGAPSSSSLYLRTFSETKLVLATDPQKVQTTITCHHWVFAPSP